MSLELSYNLRNLLTRKVTVALTVFGIALVVFVFVAALMLSAGLKKTLASTGLEENVIVTRFGAKNEIQSGVNREHAAIIAASEEVARDKNGKPRLTEDVLVLVNLKKRADNNPSNVNVRGVSASVFDVRSNVKIVQGRLPQFGTQELMVGRSINRKFAGTDLGDKIRLVGTDWPVVGVFEAGDSAFSSEIWGDSDILMPAFRRDRFSSITFRLKDPNLFESFKERIEADRRLSVNAKREQEFYADQSRSLSKFIQIIGTFVSVIFSLGAVIGAMITMYSAVANRIREIGVLRSIGFSRSSILVAFLKESLLLSVVGGVLGIALAALLTTVTVSTTNFLTFSEIGFGFDITLDIVIAGILFAATMGAAGGILPAIKASRIKIVDALRAV